MADSTRHVLGARMAMTRIDEAVRRIHAERECHYSHGWPDEPCDNEVAIAARIRALAEEEP